MYLVKLSYLDSLFKDLQCIMKRMFDWQCRSKMFANKIFPNGWFNHHSSFQQLANAPKVIQSSAVKTRSNLTRSCIWYDNDWGNTFITSYILNRHPIPRPHGWAINGVSFVRIWVKIDRVVTVPHCIVYLPIIRDTTKCPGLGHRESCLPALCPFYRYLGRARIPCSSTASKTVKE